MKLHLPSEGGVTIVENIFIDQYMPKANGEFVKLYLYLLRCAGAGKELSLSSIADVFDHTEGDVKRALAYWEKLHLLKLQYDGRGALCDILFLTGEGDGMEETAAARETYAGRKSSPSGDAFGRRETSSYGDAFAKRQSASGAEAGAAAAASASTGSRDSSSGALGGGLSRDRKRELAGQAEIRQLIFIAEQYFSRPLTSTEQSNLMYFYDTLHFSADLIEYLIEYCVSKGSASPHYMEKVAQGWYQAGITTVAQAKADSNLFNKNYFTIFHAMGIKGRNPAPVEMEFMDRWLNEYGFTIEIILEACCRTIRQTHQPNFQYADKILAQWHTQKARSLSDIKRLDAEHSAKVKEAGTQNAKAKEAGTKPAQKTVSNRFNNFPQREYDWNALEQQLLNAQSRKEG